MSKRVDNRYYDAVWDPLPKNAIDNIEVSPDNTAMEIILQAKQHILTQQLSTVVYAATFGGLFHNRNTKSPCSEWIAMIQRCLLGVANNCRVADVFRPEMPYLAVVINPEEFVALKFVQNIFGPDNAFGKIIPEVRSSGIIGEYLEKIHTFWVGYTGSMYIDQGKVLPLIQFTYDWEKSPCNPELEVDFNIAHGNCELWKRFLP